MKEKLLCCGFFVFVVVWDFWPLVAVPAIAHWVFYANWSWYLALGAIGGWLVWDFCGYLADDEREGLSLVFGWRQRHPKDEVVGYQAD